MGFSHHVKTVGPPLGLLCLMLSTWEITVRFYEISGVIVPAPSAILSVFASKGTELLRHSWITFLQAFAGYVLGCSLAFAVAVFSLFVPLFGRAIFPFAVALKATPVIVLAPLFIISLGNGLASKVVIVATVCFFPVLVAAWTGLRDIDKEWLELARIHCWGRWKVFRRVRIPLALPGIFAGLRIATSLAMIGSVVGEFSGAQAGLGFLITTSLYYLRMDIVYAAIICLCIIGVGGFYGVAGIHRAVVFWRPSPD